jgi:hypothetical protein
MMKWMQLAVLVGVACFGLTACASSGDSDLIDAQQAKNEAEKAINEGNFESEAKRLMQEIESDQP